MTTINIPVIAYHKLELTIHQTNMDGRPMMLDLGHQNVIYIRCRLGETAGGQFFNVPSDSSSGVFQDNVMIYNVSAQTVLNTPAVKNIYIGNPVSGSVAFNGLPAVRLLGLLLQGRTVTIPLAEGYNRQFLYGRGPAAIVPVADADTYIGFYTLTVEKEM
jgi:hypothetical protein